MPFFTYAERKLIGNRDDLLRDRHEIQLLFVDARRGKYAHLKARPLYK